MFNRTSPSTQTDSSWLYRREARVHLSAPLIVLGRDLHGLVSRVRVSYPFPVVAKLFSDNVVLGSRTAYL